MFGEPHLLSAVPSTPPCTDRDPHLAHYIALKIIESGIGLPILHRQIWMEDLLSKIPEEKSAHDSCVCLIRVLEFQLKKKSLWVSLGEQIRI